MIKLPGRPKKTEQRAPLRMMSFRVDAETGRKFDEIERWHRDTYGHVDRSAILRRLILAAAARELQYESPPEHQSDERTYVVYFVQRGTNGPIKIGRTMDLRQRLVSLQSACSESLTMLATTPGDYVLEEELHRRFAETRLDGEWFAPSDGLWAYIRGLT